jgi:GT2 family glycosyltransferase
LNSFEAKAGTAGRRPIYHPLKIVRWVEYTRRHGLRAALRLVERRFNPNPPYSTWVARYDRLRNRDRAAIRAHIASLRQRPKIILLMRLDAVPPRFLSEAIESVIAQLYPHWELRVVVGPAAAPETRALLDGLVGRDARISVVSGGIDWLDFAADDLVASIGPDDVLPPPALYMIAAELDAHPDADILYSDEDVVDAEGNRCDPFFKPDWSPALLHVQDYVRRLAVCRAALVREVGGPREEFEAAREYDLALRVAARTAPERIRHIPHILYHARVPQGPVVASCTEAAMRALRAHFQAIDEPADVLPGLVLGAWRVRHPLPQPAPLVSLIVPTRDRVELLRPCIDGLLHRTRYPSLEIIIVDNESREPATLAFFEELEGESRVRLLRVEGAFNFSAVNNRAVAATRGALIGLVNNDIDVIEPGWLEEMVSQAAQPGVGAVGAKLYYSDDTIQHAGVVLGIGSIAGHVHRHAPRAAAGYCGWLQTVRDVSCVTAACMLVWKRVYDEVGGLDEANLRVAFNDVDFCIKIREAGYRLVWTPYAELYHRESASRGSDLTPQHIGRFEREKAHLTERWGALLERDPFYNPNLTLEDESFSLAFPPRAGKPWRRRGWRFRRAYSAT